MKTNHSRGFVAQSHRNKAGQYYSKTSALADIKIGAHVPYNFTNGNRGMAGEAKGAKKFVNSRFRFHEKAMTKNLARDYYTETQE